MRSVNPLPIVVALPWGANNGSWFKAITEGTTSAVHYLVTGDSNSDPFDGIDKNLALMQTGLGAIKSIDAGDSAEVESEKTQALWMSGVGTAGPAIVAGTLLFVNKFAWALFMGFGPIFILCLLFEQTKSMFQKWLQFGLGIITSLAVLSFMTDVAMRMVGAMTTATLARDFLGGSSAGFTQAAMQQGGLGLILTALIITVPNMAGNFLGTFTSGFAANSVMGGMGRESGNSGGGAPASNNAGQNSTGAVNAAGTNGTKTGSDQPVMNHSKRFSTGTSSAAPDPYNAPRNNSSMGLASSGGGIASGIGDDSASVKARHAAPAAMNASNGSSKEDKPDPILDGDSQSADKTPGPLVGAAAIGADGPQVATAPDAPKGAGAANHSASAIPAAATQGGAAATPTYSPVLPSGANTAGAAAQVAGQSAPSSSIVNQAAGSRVNSSGSAAPQQTRAAPVNPSRGV